MDHLYNNFSIYYWRLYQLLEFKEWRIIMKFTLYTADCVGSLPNSIYPHKCVITDENSMKVAVAFDHVAPEYTNNHRKEYGFSFFR